MEAAIHDMVRMLEPLAFEVPAFDLEIEERDPKKFIEDLSPLWPTFAGINLEDIKAPQCFEIEEGLRARMPIPVWASIRWTASASTMPACTP